MRAPSQAAESAIVSGQEPQARGAWAAEGHGMGLRVMLPTLHSRLDLRSLPFSLCKEPLESLTETLDRPPAIPLPVQDCPGVHCKKPRQGGLGEP